MKLLTKEDIINSKDVQYKVVDVPEWGGKARVRSMTARDRDKYEASMVNARVEDGQLKRDEVTLDDYRARLCAMTMVDNAGELLFSIEDVKVLGQKSASAIQRVFNVATELNNISQEDVDDIVKNSESAQPES